MFRFLLLSCFLPFLHSWIPLTTIDYNRIKMPICIKDKAYFIDDRYTIHDTSKKKLKTKVANHMIWVKENSSNHMISEVRAVVNKPTIVEVPYEWDHIMCTLFLLIPYSFQKNLYSSEKMNTHLAEINHKKLSIVFEDTIDENIINGKVELISPYLYKLSIRDGNEWKVEQLLFFIPVSKEKTRLILYNVHRDDFLNYLQMEKKEKYHHQKIILKWLEKYKST